MKNDKISVVTQQAPLLTEADFQKMFEELLAHQHGLRDRLILLLMGYYGLRPHEVINLKSGGLNLEVAELRLAVKGRSSRSRIISLTEPHVQLFKTYLVSHRLLAANSWVFEESPGQPMTYQYLKGVVEKCAAAINFKGKLSPHSLRLYRFRAKDCFNYLRLRWSSSEKIKLSSTYFKDSRINYTYLPPAKRLLNKLSSREGSLNKLGTCVDGCECVRRNFRVRNQLRKP